MSDNGKNLMTIPATRLLTTDVEDEVKETVRKLMKLAPGGQNLSPEQAVELAVFSLMNDLNPFNGESYYIPKVGPIAGVAGYRRKANEQLRYIEQTGRFWLDFVPVEDKHPDLPPEFDAKQGDIAWKAVLHDSITKREWQRDVLNVFIELRRGDGGMEADAAWDKAREFVGPEPVWEAVGIVDHRENFSKEIWQNNKPSGEYKPDRWPKTERCKKRAEKWAIRKRFPEVNIADPELGDVVEGEFAEVKERVVQQIESEAGQKPRAEGEILNDFGYDDPNNEQAQGLGAPEYNVPPPVDTSEPLPTEDEIYQAVVDAKLSENVHAAKKALAKCETGYFTIERAVAWMRNYRGMRDEGLSSEEAAKLANRGVKPGNQTEMGL